jgi:hypothetical protein
MTPFEFAAAWKNSRAAVTDSFQNAALAVSKQAHNW